MCKWEEQLSNVQISKCANEKTVINQCANWQMGKCVNEKTVINYKNPPISGFFIC
jgi:hypothetical protein